MFAMQAPPAGEPLKIHLEATTGVIGALVKYLYKDVVDKKVDKGEVDFVQQILDEVPQRPLHQVLDPVLDKK